MRSIATDLSSLHFTESTTGVRPVVLPAVAAAYRHEAPAPTRR
jgi:hypothetical protein